LIFIIIEYTRWFFWLFIIYSSCPCYQVDLSDYVNSGTWNIISCPGVYNHTWDAAEQHHKAQITFTLKIRRMTLFYTVNLIIPCVLISFLSVCVFYLPADAGEKMTMCISILLALVVFLLLVSKILPPTSITIPLIAKYLLFTFIMNIVTILITVIIINWNFKTPRTHRMPTWVRVVFLNWLPRILVMTRPYHAERWAMKAYSKRSQLSIDPGGVGGRLRQYNTSACSPVVPASSRGGAELVELADVLLRASHSNCCTRHPAEQPGAANVVMPPGGTTRAGSYPADTSRFFEETLRSFTCTPPPAAVVRPPEVPAESSFHIAPDTQKAIEAVRFIAAHLKNEDDYAEVGTIFRNLV